MSHNTRTRRPPCNIYIHSSAQAHRTKPARRKIHLWRHADIDKLKQDARTFTTSFTQTFTIDSSIHTMWYNIKSNLTDLQEQHVPSKFTTTRFRQPWITTEIKRITRRKQRAYNRSRNKPTTSREHNNYRELQNRQNNSANLPTTHQQPNLTRQQH